jgi:predicted 3-demethylubiquinone-9 3-methyltransferase (glyoxalase superfamily)
MQKITPFLWFDREAEEAAAYYVSVFRNSRIISVSRYAEGSAEPVGMKAGTVMTVEFELDGQRFTALNGGPMFQFSPAISFVVGCDGQEDVDYYWSKLSAVPEAEQCGWCCDRFGLSWQIVPDAVMALIDDKDPIRAGRAMSALLKMKKIDIALIRKAYDGL